MLYVCILLTTPMTKGVLRNLACSLVAHTLWMCGSLFCEMLCSAAAAQILNGAGFIQFNL